MNNKEFVIIKCTNCGKEIRMKRESVSVFCMSCKKWTKISYNKENKGERK